MRLRSRLHFAALALLVGAAACTDESPFLSGDPNFPDGRPVTLETVIPAASFLTVEGAFTGYTRANDVPYAVVANTFDGGVTARTLLNFPGAFPAELSYTQDNVARSDTLYTIISAEIVLEVDSSASGSAVVPLAVHRLAAPWQDSVVSWTVRGKDSTGVHNWTTPGGDFGAQVGAGSYFPGDSASNAVIPIDAAEATAIRRDTSESYPGLLIRATGANSLITVTNAHLKMVLRPSNSVRDTSITVTANVAADSFAFIYDQEPPAPPGLLQAGTVRSARSLFSLNLPDSLDVCTPTCVRMETGKLALHQVSLLLRPRAATGGYRLRDSAAIYLRAVSEPELGQLAPLGGEIIGSFDGLGRQAASRRAYAASDTLVELPFTVHAARVLAGDSLATTHFALLGSTWDSFDLSPFSLLLFDADPRLRIVFTVPERPRLP